jgi:hypothetical protein
MTTSTALEALARLHLPDYRREVPELSLGSTSGAPKGVSVEQEVTYAQHIRPLFRDRDIQSMSFRALGRPTGRAPPHLDRSRIDAVAHSQPRRGSPLADRRPVASGGPH